MNKRSRLVFVALLLGCHASQLAVPPPPVAPARAAVAADAPDAAVMLTADVSRPAVDVAANASPDAAPVTALEHLIRAVASGATPAQDAIDSARGVSIVRVLEATPDGRLPERASNHHLCGAALTRALPSLRADLVAAVEQAAQMEGFACDEGECLVPGMEYQAAWRVRAVVGDGGVPRITIVAQVSEATMGDAWLARVQAALTRATAAPRCAP